MEYNHGDSGIKKSEIQIINREMVTKAQINNLSIRDILIPTRK